MYDFLENSLPKNNQGEEWESPFYFEDVFKYLNCVKTWYPTGSYYICSPQVVTTDKDFVILLNTSQAEAETQLTAAGYERSCADQEEYDLADGDTLACYRKDSVNLIVTSDYETYHKWLDATELAKNMKLNDKDQRIRLFQYVLYGNTSLKGELN